MKAITKKRLISFLCRSEPNQADIKALLRTVSALLLGNAIVIPVLRDFSSTYWWIPAILGILLFYITTFNSKNKGDSK
jgi:hypothetical protein